GEHESPGDVALLLGYDFLHQMDIEFDLTQGAVRLFKPKGCESAPLSYWSKEAVAVALEGGRKIFVPVRVNDKPLSAELDSGATVFARSEVVSLIPTTSPIYNTPAARCTPPRRGNRAVMNIPDQVQPRRLHREEQGRFRIRAALRCGSAPLFPGSLCS